MDSNTTSPVKENNIAIENEQKIIAGYLPSVEYVATKDHEAVGSLLRRLRVPNIGSERARNLAV